MGHEFLLGLLHRYGYGVVGLIIMLESMGLPLPGESLMVATALYAAATGKIDITLIVLVAAAGAVLGDNFGYLIGRSVGTRVLARYGRHVGLNEKRVRLGEYLFRRHGGKVVFFGRFIAVLRTFAALLAGATRMEWRWFLLYNALGGVTWCVLYGYGAYLAGDVVRRIEGPVGISLAAVAAALAVVAVIYLKRNEKRLIQEAEASSQGH